MTIQVLNQYHDSNLGSNFQATEVAWTELYRRLDGATLLAPYTVILNQNGQAIDRTPEDLAALLRNAGGQQIIWVDYCLLPLYYAPKWWTGGIPLIGDDVNFAAFVRAANPRLVAQSLPTAWGRAPELAFMPPNPTKYPYDRGLSVNGELHRSPWRDDGSTGGFWTSGSHVTDEHVSGYDQHTYSLFGIRVGKGWYFWAYAWSVRSGIAPEDYASFILWVLDRYTNGDGPTQGPPVIIPPDELPPSATPPAEPGPNKMLTWWAGLPTLEKVALVGGAAAVVVGAALLANGTRQGGHGQGVPQEEA